MAIDSDGMPYEPDSTGHDISDPSTRMLVRDGHRGLLETFGEFVQDVDRATDRLPDSDVLLAVIAFLRQGLLPFAHWEDRQMGESPEVGEDTAFEHAFLRAEVDALAAEMAGLDTTRSADALRTIRRRVHRIEAVLELHVQKADDRHDLPSVGDPDTNDPSTAARITPRGSSLATNGGAPIPMPAAGDPRIALAHAPADAPGEERDDRTRGVREMDRPTIHDFLTRHTWGVLCTTGQGAPYAVPVSYGFDGRHLYIASGPGEKRTNLETRSGVCLTVAEVDDGDHWNSVVAIGEAYRVDDLRGKLHALRTIGRQRASTGAPSAADLARVVSAIFFRITPTRITGRIRS